jgi:hypothetical protein
MSIPHFDKAVLLLPMKGDNNGTVFTDRSQQRSPVTAVGNAKTVTAVSKFYGSSAYFDGTGDYLSIPNHSSLTLGANDYTIGLWMRLDELASTITGEHFFAQRTTGTSNHAHSFFRSSDGNLYYLITLNGSTLIYAIGKRPEFAINTWYHLAVCRSGADLRMFIDGVQAGDTYNIGTNSIFNSTNPFLIGARDTTAAGFLKGYMQDFFFINGAALYTSNFTPPERLTAWSLSGTVLDANGDPTARVLHATPRLAPNAITSTVSSDAGDGTYEFTDLVDTEHYVVCLDDDAGSDFNSLIDRKSVV